jgi:hypothetical protein
MGWVVSAKFRPLYIRERDSAPTVQEIGWALRAGLDVCGKSRRHRDQCRSVQFVASHSRYRLQYHDVCGMTKYQCCSPQHKIKAETKKLQQN